MLRAAVVGVGFVGPHYVAAIRRTVPALAVGRPEGWGEALSDLLGY